MRRDRTGDVIDDQDADVTPAKCLRHRNKPADGQFGFCRACSAGMTPSELLDEAAELQAVTR